MGLGATAGAARAAAAVYGVGVVENKPGVGPTGQPLIRGFPGVPSLTSGFGSAEFWTWVIFVAALSYMLGVHWLFGRVRAAI